MFDRTALINLDHRKDRMGAFEAKILDIPMLRDYVRYRAIHGDKVTVPGFFVSGGGAWGCRQSHLRVLEDAMLDDVNTLLVLEDDVRFTENFQTKLDAFMRAVPDDWDGLMIGGQDQASPGETGVPNVGRSIDTQRTHAYVVRGLEPMRDLYRLWARADRHIDHVFGQWQQRHVVYEPQPFLCGQDESSSDISGRADNVRYWNSVVIDTKTTPMYVLAADRNTAERLRVLGFHFGYSRDPITGYDRGMSVLAEGGWDAAKLTEWAALIAYEAQDRGDVPGVWFAPLPDRPVLEARIGRPMVYVEAASVQEAVEKIPILLPRWRAAQIVWCWRGQGHEILEGMAHHGFHRGFWKDQISGLDQGIRQAVEGDKYGLIKTIHRQLSREIEKVRYGKALLAHPDLNVDRVRAELPGVDVREISGADIREVMGSYGEALREALEMYR